MLRTPAHHAEVVRDEQGSHAAPRLQSPKQVENLALITRVKSCGWLVSNEQLGVSGERRRDGNPLTHSAGQFVGKSARNIRGQVHFG